MLWLLLFIVFPLEISMIAWAIRGLCGCVAAVFTILAAWPYVRSFLIEHAKGWGGSWRFFLKNLRPSRSSGKWSSAGVWPSTEGLVAAFQRAVGQKSP